MSMYVLLILYYIVTYGFHNSLLFISPSIKTNSPLLPQSPPNVYPPTKNLPKFLTCPQPVNVFLLPTTYLSCLSGLCVLSFTLRVTSLLVAHSHNLILT